VLKISIAVPQTSMTDFADTALVEAARAGSPDAFGVLVERYRAPLVHLAYRLTRDPEEAKDIVQDAFLCAFRRLDDFRPERPFARWLFVVARNASLDTIRRRRRAAVLSTEPEERSSQAGPEDVALRNEEAMRVRTALNALPSKYRDVLELYYVSDLRYRDIALALELPIGTVKTYISRGKRRLRAKLEEVPLRLAA